MSILDPISIDVTAKKAGVVKIVKKISWITALPSRVLMVHVPTSATRSRANARMAGKDPHANSTLMTAPKSRAQNSVLAKTQAQSLSNANARKAGSARRAPSPKAERY